MIGRRRLLAATARQTAQAAQLTPAFAASVAYLSYPLGSRWMEIGRGRAAMGREYTAAYQVPAPRADCAFAAWLRRDPPPAHGRAGPGPTGPRRVAQPVLVRPPARPAGMASPGHGGRSSPSLRRAPLGSPFAPFARFIPTPFAAPWSAGLRELEKASFQVCFRYHARFATPSLAVR